MPKMRLLCLHGAGTSANILESQLGPVARELQEDDSVEFVFVDGHLESLSAPGVEEIYEGPYRCYYPWSLSRDKVNAGSRADAYELIYTAIEEEGPFDGILGFSQGATLACSFILNHAETHPLDLPFEPFRCAVFICGLPPFKEDGIRLTYSESTGRLVKIPTVHVGGEKDEFLRGTLALHELCEQDKATLYCHGKGHTIPGDQKTTMAIASAIRELNDKTTFM